MTTLIRLISYVIAVTFWIIAVVYITPPLLLFLLVLMLCGIAEAVITDKQTRLKWTEKKIVAITQLLPCGISRLSKVVFVSNGFNDIEQVEIENLEDAKNQEGNDKAEDSTTEEEGAFGVLLGAALILVYATAVWHGVLVIFGVDLIH